MEVLTDFNVVKPGDASSGNRALLGAHDDDIAHLAVNNYSQIPDNKRLEEIDRKARRMFFQENGPVTLRTLMLKWEGFKALKESEDPSEIRAATFYYWS